MHSRRFGEVKFGPACMEPVETPVGEKCTHCDEAVAKGDSGLMIPNVMMKLPDDPFGKLQAEVVFKPMHRECFLRGVYGSVGHQMGKCPCRGGNTEDPEGMSPRQAAWASVEYMEKVGPFFGPVEKV